MPVGHWSGAAFGETESWEAWDEPQVVSRNISPDAFMEELCTAAGGYARFFRTLTLHYLGWWGGAVAIPALFLDHHRCEVRLPYLDWFVYGATLAAMLAMAVLMELSVIQRLGLLPPGELLEVWRRWQLPTLATVLWKLDSYTDVVFIFIARDCGSSLWWASLATFIFGVVFCQLLLNMCFACTDCDHELPSSFGFILLDFKLVNAAVLEILPFDPDASHLPVARPVTLRTTSHLIGVEKAIGDVAQVCIQSLFLINAKIPHGFVIFSLLVGVLHCGLAIFVVLRGCVWDEFALQSHGLQQGTALLPDAFSAPTLQLSESTHLAANLGTGVTGKLSTGGTGACGTSSSSLSAGGAAAVAPRSLGRSYRERERERERERDREDDLLRSGRDGRGPRSARSYGSSAAAEELDLL